MGESICPSCAAKLIWPELRVGVVFECPHCGAKLRTLNTISQVVTLTSIALANLVPFILGLSLARWLLLAVASIIPINVILIRLIYPRLRPDVFLE